MAEAAAVLDARLLTVVSSIHIAAVPDLPNSHATLLVAVALPPKEISPDATIVINLSLD
jgi:hypothetical protein